MAGTEYIDHLVVGQITFKTTGQVVSAATGVGGLVTAPAGTKQIITSQPTAPTQTAGSAGATYTATEQGIINALVAQVNALQTALKNSGHLK